MTTIACNTTEIACDLQLTLDGSHKFKGASKIFKFQPHELHYKEPFYIGFAGSSSEMIDVVDWYNHPELYPAFPKIRKLLGLVLTESGKIFYFNHPAKWIACKDGVAAMGSGASIALGALHTGASPKEAVVAASKVDPFTGMGTKVYKIGQPKA